jgi:hypothetical protein
MGDVEKGYLDHAWRLNFNLNQTCLGYDSGGRGIFLPDFTDNPSELSVFSKHY